ncbi:MAG: CRISPR-associated ring nuclease Csm6 [Deltaproteobacteria bacterium]|nr:CRISPR-associated ring nuclease Csm6 [Deltaproteobacteria bacterium]
MKTILLAVIGLNPQVLTETLYALHKEGRHVDEIHVITTRAGKEQIYATLLSPHDGMFQKYLDDYRIAPGAIAFAFDHVHVVRDAKGIELDDIRDEDDNALLMKTCAELTYRFTNDSNQAVFFSIAGGRKTMSACLMAAAQFYGRVQDRIYHVLVTPEFESNRNFFYPPPASGPIELHDRDGRPYVRETRYAEVQLVLIPFVSLRDRLSEDMLREPKDPATLMLSLIREKPALLEVDLHAGCLRYKGRELDVHPSHLAVYAFFARGKRSCTLDTGCRSCSKCYLSITGILDRTGQIMNIYRTIAGTRELAAMSDTGIMNLNAENFHSYKSKLKHDIIAVFGLSSSHELVIESKGKKPDTCFGIRIPRERIRVIL